MANEAEIENWSGARGDHWAAEAERYDRMLRPYLGAVVEAVAVQPGERVVDIGCGNGALSLALAERVGADGEVTGIDISVPMLEAARLRAADAGRHNLRFLDADAQVHLFEPGRYDALVSRFGVMFFDDPLAAFCNLSVALRPGGRLAFACWRAGFESEWISVGATAMLEHVPAPELADPDAPGPFAFADPDRLRGMLGDAGFVDVAIAPFDARAPYGDSVADTIRFLKTSELSRALTEGVDPELVERGWLAVADALAPFEGPDGVVLGGAAWLVTARRP